MPLPRPLHRFPHNPIISPADVANDCSAVFNCGAIAHEDGVALLLRVENDVRQTSFKYAYSSDGIAFTIDEEPISYPLRDVEEAWGAHRFDMRITRLEDTYYACHATWLQGLGCGIGIARSDDLRTFTPVGTISPVSNRNGVLFPEKIGGRYARLERPQDVDGSGTIWISYSPDLIHWGDARPLRLPELAWGTRKLGAGAVPIRTEHGWLEIYHATAMTASTENYYLGVMLLDLKDPSKIVAAPRRFILQPEEPYECTGQVPNVVFTAGTVIMPDDTVNVYYGGADTRVCLATSSLDELVAFCLEDHPSADQQGLILQDLNLCGLYHTVTCTVSPASRRADSQPNFRSIHHVAYDLFIA